MKIEILTDTGITKIDADVIGPTAVHKDTRHKFFVITHMASGAAFPFQFPDVVSATTAASEINRIKNFWGTIDTGELLPVHFKDATRKIAKKHGGLYKPKAKLLYGGGGPMLNRHSDN